MLKTFLYRTLLLLTILSLSVSANAQDGKPSKEKEKKLIAVLASDAEGGEKALACKALTTEGSAEAVPELAKLLSNEQLASWARIALEAIPGPEADEALTKATETLKGKLLVGTINSLGVRRPASAVDALVKQLANEDQDAAAAAAVALGHIDSDPAVKSLREALTSSKTNRSAIAEGLVLAAERRLGQGKANDAAALYDEVRGAADLPQPRVVEATRGAILARGNKGIPLLIEQLKARDRQMFFLGLYVARELPGDEVTEALAKEAATGDSDRAPLILYALADRQLPAVPPAVMEIVKAGTKDARIAAITLLGQKGNDTNVGSLVAAAIEADSEISQAAKAALKDLAGDKVNNAITALLGKSEGKTLAVLFELIGQRRIEAIAAVVKALDHADPTVRSAALTALGETATNKEVKVLLARVIAAKNADDIAAAQKALRVACVRMPEREACAAEVAAALPKAPVATQSNMLETLAAMGGPKALETIASAVKGNEPELQDTGSKLLGEWMTTDAGPVLLDLVKTVKNSKYQNRALSGYRRIARQFVMSDKERAVMAQNALDVSTRTNDLKDALVILERYPSMDTLPVAIKAIQLNAIKEDATLTAMFVAQKIAQKDATQKDPAQKLLIQAGIQPIKVEIVKAEYGAADKQRDVTAILQKQAGDYPVVVLISPTNSYNKEFGGDPAPNSEKKLKVQYKINGKTGEATFAENATILLPMPK
jgi:HEAT repeat protein